jgi:hypothetical protein
LTENANRSGRRGFNPREVLAGCIAAGWYCQQTGIPLVFPPTLCLLERLVSCAGGNASSCTSGYYDWRQTGWNAPLLYLTYPAADHVLAWSNKGITDGSNLQMLAGPINEAKGESPLAVIVPQARADRAREEAEAAALGAEIVYWPPTRTLWDDPSRVPEAERAARKGRNAACPEWDGMLGVFLRLYHPALPELQVEWTLREHAKEPSYLAKWYGVVFDVLNAQDRLRERYAQIVTAAPTPVWRRAWRIRSLAT